MTDTNKKTVVIGASPNPARYAYKATRQLSAKGHTVIPVGIREGNIEGIDIVLDRPPIAGVHTVTLYLNPQKQQPYYDYILGLNPERIVFNPGAENPELYKLAEEAGIKPVEACTLVMLSTGAY